MNLTEQTINNTNQVNITDSLNSALMELKIKRTATTTVPETNELIVYVDQSSKENPTEKKKQYVYDLIKPLALYNDVSDEFLIRLRIKNNNVNMETMVKRFIGENENGEYLLEYIKFDLIDIDTETKILNSYYAEWSLLWFEAIISLRKSEIKMKGEK